MERGDHASLQRRRPSLPRPELLQFEWRRRPRGRAHHGPGGRRRFPLRRRRRRRRVPLRRQRRHVGAPDRRLCPRSRSAGSSSRPTARSGSATGEANTGATAYVGTGVYRLPNPAHRCVHHVQCGSGASNSRAPPSASCASTASGNVYAATSRGIWRHSSAGNTRHPPGYAGLRADARVRRRPTTTSATTSPSIRAPAASTLIANCAWRSGAAYNGFYLSTDGGNTWALINPKGALNPQDVGRGTFAYSADGSQLYVVLESSRC